MTFSAAAVIPSNNPERIKRCFQHLVKQTVQFDRIIVVVWDRAMLNKQRVIESASRIISKVEIVESGFDTRPETNLNRGIRCLSTNPTDFVAFLNDDTYLDERWHESMQNAACNHGKKALYASVVQFDSNPNLIQSAGHFLNRSRPLDLHYKTRFQQVPDLPEPLCPCGNAAFIPWCAIEQIQEKEDQVWDPSFERWQSCFDFGLKMRLLGYDCHLISSAHALHDGYLDQILMGHLLEEKDVKNQLRSRLLLYGKFFPEAERKEALQLLERSVDRWERKGYPGSEIKGDRIKSLFEIAQVESENLLKQSSHLWLERVERLDVQSQRKLLWGEF
jgi:GT2 family glycosyltransferase